MMAEAKKFIHVEPVSAQRKVVAVDEIKIEGHDLVFSWYNTNTAKRRGFSFWKPVRRDTELGEEVSKQYEPDTVRHEGLNTDSNFFYLGNDAIMVYTTRELWDDKLKSDQAAADRQFAALGPEAKVSRFHVKTEGLKRGD